MEHSMSEGIPEFDMSQEPLDFVLDDPNPMQWLESSTESEASHGPVMERIRHLEAVGSRVLERRPGGRQDQTLQVQNPSVDERTLNDTVKMDKGRSSHLIAKALGMDGSARGGGFYDCNVCLKTARDPVVTCCGHLFCWQCFYLLPYLEGNLKECPACEGMVADTSITPIYGNRDDSCKHKTLEGGITVKIPPRPRACRIESVRQQQRLPATTDVPLHEGIRHRFTSIISIVQNRENLNYAMNSAGRLVQDMEVYMASPQVSLINLNSSPAPPQSENQTQNAGGPLFGGPPEPLNGSNVASVANFLDETVVPSTDNDSAVPFVPFR